MLSLRGRRGVVAIYNRNVTERSLQTPLNYSYDPKEQPYSVAEKLSLRLYTAVLIICCERNGRKKKYMEEARRLLSQQNAHVVVRSALTRCGRAHFCLCLALTRFSP